MNALVFLETGSECISFLRQEVSALVFLETGSECMGFLREKKWVDEFSKTRTERVILEKWVNVLSQ